MNLVSVASQYLTPALVAKIASFTGLDQAIVQKAVTAAIPALFAGLVNSASKPGGAQHLFDAVTRHPAGDISALESAGELEQSELAANGKELLSSLFGGSTFNGLRQAVGAFSGAGEGKAGALLASLAPVVLGALGQQQRKSGLDASGLSKLLMSQRDNIAGAMPAGMASLLSEAGLTDTLKRGSETVSRAAAGQARRATGELRDSSMNWAYWALPLAALAGLAWWFAATPSDETRTVQTTVPATEMKGRAATAAPPLPELPSIASLAAGGVPVGRNVTDVVDSLRVALSGVTDAASARAAVPKLQSAAQMLDETQSAAGQLPAAGKATLASYIRTASPVLKQQFDKVMALPGVGEVLKPIADAVLTKIDTMASV